MSETPANSAPAAARGQIKTRSYQHLFNSSALGTEIVLVFFVGLTAYGLRLAPPLQIWVTVGVGILLCVVGLALARTSLGVGFAAVVQVLLILTGLIIPIMWFLGGVFAAVWLAAMIIGAKIDREKKAYALSHPEEYPELQER